MGDPNAPAAPAPDVGQQEPDEPDQRLLRALADLDNVRKRYERRLAVATEEERNRVVSLWLPVVDDLERALEFADSDPERVISGVRSVYENALAVLARLGFERFEDVGKPFDPARHEAVATIGADAPAGSIVGTARPGYTSNTGTIRPAHVVVAHADHPDEPESKKHADGSP